MSLNSIEEALDDLKSGKVIIVVDDENRENEGDFVAAAEKVTPDLVNFMIKNGTKQFIEIGPGKVLSGLIKRIDKNVKVSAINNEEDISVVKIND